MRTQIQNLFQISTVIEGASSSDPSTAWTPFQCHQGQEGRWPSRACLPYTHREKYHFLQKIMETSEVDRRKSFVHLQQMAV